MATREAGLVFFCLRGETACFDFGSIPGSSRIFSKRSPAASSENMWKVLPSSEEEAQFISIHNIQRLRCSSENKKSAECACLPFCACVCGMLFEFANYGVAIMLYVCDFLKDDERRMNFGLRIQSDCA